MTPLFPNDNEIITLMQGTTGDCYLLAALDCIFHLDKKGRNKVKSQFTETDDGVIVRIKHHAQSVGLEQKTKGSKYEYFFDPITNEDVFKISKENLKIIDQAVDGVQTNSLAVKILERLSAYYFVSDWDKAATNASIIAHNLDDRYSGSPTRFVGRLTDIDAYDTTNVEEIIKLKTINPRLPVYISIRYGDADASGVIHERHALRIKHIIPKHPDYQFVLVNPWNNRLEEPYSLDEMKKRKCRFSTYSLDKNEHAVTRALLHCPTAHGKYVFANPTLLNMLIEMQKKGFVLTPQKIAACIKLHQQMPYLQLLLNSIPAVKQEKMLIEIINAGGDQRQFIKWAITKFPNLAFIKVILEQSTDHQSMGSILTDLALSAKKGQSLHGVFSEPAFFKLVYDTAIQHKQTQLADTMERAEKEIELGLIHHLLQSKERYPTRNAGLRSLIYANIFTETMLKSVIRPELLLAYSVAHLITYGSVPAHLVEPITQCDASVVNKAFLKRLLDNLSCRNPRELFVGIKKISDLNPELAKTLFFLIAPKINTLFKVSYAQFAKEINLETNEFRNWFFTMPQPPGAPSEQELITLKEAAEMEHAQEVMAAYVQQIREFRVDFSHMTTPKEVEARRIALGDILHNLIDQADLRQAKIILGSDTQLVRELSSKLQEIQLTAEQHIKIYKLEQAEKIVESYRQRIQLIPVLFYDAITTKKIEDQQAALKAELENIVMDQPDLQQAERILGFSHRHPRITRAYSDKLERINFAAEQQINEMRIRELAEQQRLKLNRAKEVIRIFVQQIDSFVVPPNRGKNSQDIERQQRILVSQLENTVRNRPDLTQAALFLGHTDHQHPDIKRALQYKNEEIRREAERATLSQREVLVVLEQINFSQHLLTIERMARVLEEKVERHHENYVNAAQFARALHTKFLEEEECILTSNKPQQIRIEDFKNNCLIAIETALTVLEEHRGWKQFLADVASAILAILTVGMVNLATGRWRLFTPQTNSEKITKEVESVIQSISVGA